MGVLLNVRDNRYRDNCFYPWRGSLSSLFFIAIMFSSLRLTAPAKDPAP